MVKHPLLVLLYQQNNLNSSHNKGSILCIINVYTNDAGRKSNKTTSITRDGTTTTASP
jgi:hypothetical protein